MSGIKGKSGVYKRTEANKKNISNAKKKEYQNGKISPLIKIWKENPDFLRGENNPVWIKDRSKVIGVQDRNNPEYKQWRYQIFKRDRHICKINNKDCMGNVVAHYILGFAQYPELRYEVNNGITLCHFHHPRKRIDEEKLIPVLKGLVEVIRQ
jgi:hypothetical protein